MGRPHLVPSGWLTVAAAPLLAASAVGQAPPQLLPPSITGRAAPQPTPVSPASGVVAPAASAQAAPIARFQNLRAFPEETVHALYGMRAGADWLSRMNQANGRFRPGINPGVPVVLGDDPDFRQAIAACALAEAALFTGDETLAARATQTVLTLLTLTKPDPADPTCRVPVAASEKCNRVGFAAAVALAIYHLPAADPKLVGQAEELCGFLKKQCRPNGAVGYADDPAAEPLKVDPEGERVYPGLAVQALAASNRVRPDAGKRDCLMRAVAYYRSAFQARPHALFAASLIPGFVDCCLQMNKDASAPVQTAVWELADHLCGCQYSVGDGKSPAWVSGFRTGSVNGEPTADSAVCAGGLAAAAKLTRHVPDLVRYPKYRAAAVNGLTFARGLQFSDETAGHFEAGFRGRFLVGGVHLSPTDGTVRADATGQLVSAHLAFLQSGAEGRVD